MNNASLGHWLEKIESIHPEEVELGLARVSSVAEVLQLLPVPQPVVTVAGTNGKGSVVAVLEALLAEAGVSTGTFTSPHFLRFNERIRVSGEEAADAEIVAAFARIDEARGDVPLTYFEFATLAALLMFRERDPNILLLEVGLGGRLDAVNMVDPAVAVITSIDLDHQGWLGESRGEIAREKGGIMRRNVPVVIGEPEPPGELVKQVDEVGAYPALYIGRDFTVAVENGEWRAGLVNTEGVVRRINARACGALVPENIATALQAAELLNIPFSEDQLTVALSRAAPMGRRQLHRAQGMEFILDVAHNPASVRKLVEYLDVTPCSGKTIGIFSIMADKDIKAAVDAASGHFDAWFVADQPGNGRAAKASDLAALLRTAGESMISINRNLRQAMGRARQIAGEGDRLVVFGSFYTVAAALPLLGGEQETNGDIG